MVIVNSHGYISRVRKGARKPNNSLSVSSELFLVKHQTVNRGALSLGLVMFPKEFIGRKIRFKVEVVPE